MGQILVLFFLTIFSFHVSAWQNMMMNKHAGNPLVGPKTMAQPLSPEYVPEGMYNQEIMSEDGILMGYELRELPAEEISYQNGNCVNGQVCPGAPVPKPRPVREGEESCAIHPDQSHCQAQDSIEKNGDGDDNPDPDSDKEDNDKQVADRGPTGPSQACQSALAQTRQCSQAPQVTVGIPTGNILGNYDAAAQTMRNGSNTLSQYSIRCQSLMSDCANQCSTNNPYDSSLKSQCSAHQNQVQQAYGDAQHLNAMSTQVEQAALEIRSGQSGFKQNLGIGQGIGLQVYQPTEITENGKVKLVNDLPLLSNVKMKSYDEVVDEEEKEIEKLNLQAKPLATVSMVSLSNKQKPAGALGEKTRVLKASKKKDSDEVEYFDVASRRIIKHKNTSGNQGSYGSYNSQTGKVYKKSKLASAEEILKKQWMEEQKARGVASGVTRQDQFIFHTICLNYDSYERLFDIQQGSSKCPPAH